MASRFTFAPLTAANFSALETLFGPRGACGGCWCMTWRAPRADYEKQKGEGNRQALRALVESGEPVGLLAFHGDEPVGWISVAPRSQFTYLARTRTLQPPDEKPVWSVTCFFIAKAYRGHGLARQLLAAAAKWAKSQGCSTLEGYPIMPPASDVPPVFAWTGLPQTFENCGFTDCRVASKSRLLVRKDL